MKSRHRAREVALQILYGYEMSSQDRGLNPPKGTALIDDLHHHFEHFKVPPEIREFSAELVTGTLRDQANLDKKIENHAVNWKIERMSSIDRTLLRMAIFEMMQFPDIPHSVTMDEAIELGKQFGTSDSSSFINGILDAVKKEIDSIASESN